MTIDTLIDKQDTFEIVRDQLAAILLAETTSQQALATAAAKDPEQWRFRIFSERSNPWSEFLDATTQQVPLVNVALTDINFDMGSSSIVDHRKATAVYNIDVYGHGIAQEVTSGGHTVGDEKAALEAHRGIRFVRNVFDSGYYTYLELRKTVHRRWIESIAMFPPEFNGQQIQQVCTGRISLRVEFNEYSPQVSGQIIELISATIKRKETGEVYFVGDYPQ